MKTKAKAEETLFTHPQDAPAVTHTLAPSTQELGAARKKAEELVALATLPQEVKLPDGTTLSLCLRGRIYRGLTLRNAETNEARARQLEAGLRMLQDADEKAREAASLAVENFRLLCIAAGMEVRIDALYPPCPCAYCKEDRAWQAYDAAQRAMRAAMGDAFLSASPADPPPALAELLGPPEAAKPLLAALAAAMARYDIAAKEATDSPGWGRMAWAGIFGLSCI